MQCVYIQWDAKLMHNFTPLHMTAKIKWNAPSENYSIDIDWETCILHIDTYFVLYIYIECNLFFSF